MVNPVLAEVVRSDFVESAHRGRLVVVQADGQVSAALGAVDTPIFPRSSNKPLQATALIRSGVELLDEQLALATGSHWGEPNHIATVRKILANAGLEESNLQCPAAMPTSPDEHIAWANAGRGPSPLAMVCSGKHAAMLATCVANGWPVTDYLDVAHPLQQAIAAAVQRLTGEPIAPIGIDGCGAPIFGTSLLGLARGFSRLAQGAAGSAEHRVATAMRAHPTMVEGVIGPDSLAMQTVPGLICKHGAEAVLAAAIPNGAAVAIKIDDGSARALHVLLNAVLIELGDTEGLGASGRAAVLGGGREVGEIQPAFASLELARLQ